MTFNKQQLNSASTDHSCNKCFFTFSHLRFKITIVNALIRVLHTVQYTIVKEIMYPLFLLEETFELIFLASFTSRLYALGFRLLLYSSNFPALTPYIMFTFVKQLLHYCFRSPTPKLRPLRLSS